MKLTNYNIYNYAQALHNYQIEDRLPIKINFFLQKNINKVRQAAAEIEEARVEIAKSFGELDEENDAYFIPPEKSAAAAKEITDLFNIEQDIDLHIFKLDEFDDIKLTLQQLSAIMFMIEE